MPLSPAAHAFTTHLAGLTGLNPAVIAGWVMAETSGHDTTNGPNNWLNVGSFDSGFQGGGANVWQNPVTAAAATAAFLRGHPVNGIAPPLGGGAPSVRGILGTVGKGIPAQVQAIQNSGWASSHYNGNLMADVRPFVGQNFQVGSVPGATPVPGAQPVKVGAVRVPFQTTSTKLDPASIAGSFLANESSVNPWTLPTPGSSKVSTGSNPLLSTGILPATLQTTTTTRTQNVVAKAQTRLQQLAGGTNLNTHPGSLPPGQGDVNPLAHGWTLTETDMGVDASAPAGTPILAMNDSRVVNIDPSWYAGQPFVQMQILNGPNKGKFWYVSEQITGIPKVGQVIRRGQVVARFAPSGTGIEIGWGSGRTGVTLAQSQDSQAVLNNRHTAGTPQGINFSQTVLHHAPVSIG